MKPSDGHVRFRTDDQPEVEVLWDGVWCFGLLAEWKQTDGRWVGTVRFNHGVGKNRIEAFDQDLIRSFLDVSGRSDVPS